VAVYLFNLNIKESLTKLEVINIVRDIVLAILILLRLILIKHEFNNNINNKVLFIINIKTSISYCHTHRRF
jgi:hypothetical protein